jgi:lysophospholipase L1-like esterase
MRDAIIKRLTSSMAIALGCLLILIFIAAMKHPDAKKTVTYLALGDSYTIGEKVPVADNFPNQTVQLLRKEGLDVKPPRIVAKTGWTTDELQENLSKSALDESYDFVTLLVGVNNQYRGRSITDYEPQFENLLQQAIAFAANDPARVIVLSIPDWGVTPFAEGRNKEKIAQEIDAYNDANKTMAQKFKVHYINITPGSRLAATNSSLLAEDGLHPSGKEYAIWAKEISNYIQTKL